MSNVVHTKSTDTIKKYKPEWYRKVCKCGYEVTVHTDQPVVLAESVCPKCKKKAWTYSSSCEQMNKKIERKVEKSAKKKRRKTA
jgi:hypothetical protein